jgi:ribosome-associated protein
MAGEIRVTPRISLDEDELQEEFVRASGPGGQHVNKTDSAVQLRFDVAASPNLPHEVKARLVKLAGSRMTAAGMLIIVGDSYRSQLRNREDVRERLVDLIRDASVPPKPRRPTKPTYGSQQRRLESKAKRAGIKQLRSGRPDD